MYLKKCIDSIYDQKYKNIEVIVINDGSTEKETLLVLKHIQQKYSNIKIISQKNKGVSASRNEGIRKSKGNWILFVDSDDFLSINTFDFFKNKLDIKYDIIMFSLNNYYNEKRSKKNSFLNGITKELNHNDKIQLQLQILSKNYSIYTPPQSMIGVVACKFYRREFLIEKNLFFDENIKYSEDGIFAFKALFYSKKVSYYDQYFYYYRKHSESVTAKYNESTFVEHKKSLLSISNIIDKFKLVDNDIYMWAYQARIVLTINILISMIEKEYLGKNRRRQIEKILNNQFIVKELKGIKLSEYGKRHQPVQVIKLFLLKNRQLFLYSKFNSLITLLKNR